MDTDILYGRAIRNLKEQYYRETKPSRDLLVKLMSESSMQIIINKETNEIISTIYSNEDAIESVKKQIDIIEAKYVEIANRETASAINHFLVT